MERDNELATLLSIAAYYRLNRGVGHTSAMMGGASFTQNVLVLVHNEMFAKDIKGYYPNAAGFKVISPHSAASLTRELWTQHRPLVIDHHHLANLIEALPAIIHEREDEIAKAAYDLGKEDGRFEGEGFALGQAVAWGRWTSRIRRALELWKQKATESSERRSIPDDARREVKRKREQEKWRNQSIHFKKV